MSRTRYSDEERRRIAVRLVEAAGALMKAGGVKNASIRKVARAAGCSSASLYRYFKNLDELVNMACLHCMEDCCREIAAFRQDGRDSRETYIRTWDALCRYAFANPEIFCHVFFASSDSLSGEAIRAYYALFPAGAEREAPLRETMQLLFAGSSPSDRGYALLRPMVQERALQEAAARQISVLVTGYFRSLLETRRDEGPGESGEDRIQKQMRAVSFLLERAC